jgi:4-amino-4-deoxy-L-arabinose transferase-like glycosyltransferase
MTPEERAAGVPARRLALVLALAVVGLFFLATHRYWVPADSNLDENAYLLSGKLLARTGSPGFVPPDPYSLVGMMWVTAPAGRCYPKYPLGQTLLVAAAVAAGGLRAPFWISPVLMTLGLLGVFLLVREAVGPFAGLLAMLAMATSPALLAETNDPDSHGAVVCFTTWGMLLLLRWGRTGKPSQAALAGLLLGLSAVTRYTEGLLLLPMGLVTLPAPGARRDRRRLAGTGALAAGWLLPVGAQVAFNLRVFHRLTGYDETNESTAFAPRYFLEHAGLVLRQLSTLGLPLLFPLAALGLALLMARGRRSALVLWAWVLPSLLLYTAYYWAVDDVAYTRFFLTILPPLALGMAWLLTRPLPGPEWLRRRVQPALALALVLACGAYGVREALPILRGVQEDQTVARDTAAAALAAAPAGATFFGPVQPMLYLQYAGDGYRLYGRNVFLPQAVERLGRRDPRAPNPLQPKRARALYRRLKGRKPVGLLRLQRTLTADALGEGRRVFVILPAGDAAATRFASPELDDRDARSFALRPVSRWAGWEEGDGPAGRRPMVWEMLEVTMSPARAPLLHEVR